MMTIFSYICGKIFSKEFGEPKLLNKLLDRSFSGNDIKEDSPLGWIIHFAIGFLFAWIMHLYFLWTDHTPTWPIGSLLGLALGVLGVTGWAMALNFHRSPPKPELPQFYLQLVVAHVIFGLGTVLVFKAMDGLP
jgi:uncharacterized membrane protein YedE/YeeE